MYERVHTLRREIPVTRACAALGVSTSAYYEWARAQGQEPSEKVIEARQLEHEIRVIFDESRGTYGRTRIQEALRRKGKRVGLNRIRRLMKKMGLVAKPRRIFKLTTLSDHDERVSPNLLSRNFTADAPNRVWVSDISVPQKAAREMRDRPLAIGLQEQVANHRKRLGSKAPVVSVAEKAP